MLGSRKANGGGFTLQGLNKLTNTKSNKGVTVLEYVIDGLEQNKSPLLEWYDSMPHVKQAKPLRF